MRQALIDARELLNAVTPLKYDCGRACGNACCLPDGDGQGGVMLLPGEEEALRGASWARLTPLGDETLLICDGLCDRNLRPMGCMIFPLIPAVNEEGRWGVRMDSRARAMCPLYSSGIRGLERPFVSGVKRAVSIMSRDALLNAYMLKWMEREREFRKTCEVFTGGRNG